MEYRAQAADFDELMQVPVLRFTSIDGLTLDPSRPARYIVNDPDHSLPLDFLFIPGGGESLMVGFHGAEGRASVSLPKFQFVTSLRAHGDPVLALSDSTLLRSERLSIGWFAGDAATPLADLYGRVVSQVAELLGVARTVLVGHSAGGFSAIRVGMRVPNSHTVAVNGQAIAIEHRPYVVQNLQEDVYPESGSAQAMVEEYADRFDLRAALATREPTSSFTFFAHREDRLSFSDHPHFPLFSAHFGLGREGGRTDHGDSFVPCIWASKNPSPHALPGSVMPFLNLAFGRSALGIAHDVDPRMPSLV